MYVEVDNDDLCTLLVIDSLKRKKGRDERIVVERGIPMIVKIRWFELPFVRIKESIDAATRYSTRN